VPENLLDLFDALEADPWRAEQPFSREIEDAHAVLFDPLASKERRAEALAEWLKEHQPCLFGRMAAKAEIAYSVVTEADVLKGEEHVRDIIQLSRRVWKRNGLLGRQHGFVISLMSPTVANARPGPVLRDFALRLCGIYLSEESVATDSIFLDSLPLTISRPDLREHRIWKVGVNFFGAQADQRWWHDHRMPGGIAFSMNSVGHMTRARLETELPKRPALAQIKPADRLVDFALPFAMRTIHRASKGALPGTRLADRDSSCTLPDPIRTAALREMALFNERVYFGQYNTDITVPSEYFDPSAVKPMHLKELKLDFTYLHDKAEEDYGLMGIGEEIPEQEILDALGWAE
jgi:hypothetical protein